MSNKRYPEEFRIEAVKQVTESNGMDPFSPTGINVPDWKC